MCPKTSLKKHGSTTTNLLRHIKKVHANKLPKQPLITEHANVPTKYALNSIKKKSLDNMVAIWIAQDMRPMHAVEGEGFKKLIQMLDPKYQLPTHKTISKSIIPRLVGETKNAICESLLQARSVALTTDMWSSSTCTSFMAVTAHYMDGELTSSLLDCSSFHGRHTSENITKRLLDVVADFDISLKVICVVSDNAANVTKAIRDAHMKDIPCFTHTLNLCIRDALLAMTAFEPLRKKIADLATFLHRSNNGKDDFVSCQVRLGIMPVKVLMGDVKTRWNSVYTMLSRFLELKESVVLFQTTASGKDYFFSQDEWQMALDVKVLLEPAFEATVELSGERYMSGTKVCT
jgi:hypothetical protein